jgi:transcriptional regulator with XRE-family HTH domain
MASAHRITLALRRQGWSKSRLGRELGISQACASQLANGVYVGAHHFPKIAQLLDVSEEWLRTGYPEPPWLASFLANLEGTPDPTPTQPARRDEAVLVRLLTEAERERDALRDRVRRLEGTIAWQAEQLQAFHTGKTGGEATVMPTPAVVPTFTPDYDSPLFPNL